jgi:DTW domain-containing protein YfiP
LLQACLPETLILAWTGKQTAPAGFAQALAAERTTPFLLFPGAGVSAEEAHQRAGGTGRSPLFILLDGSWRQARKMRGTASWLHGIPTASLDVGPSLSRLRRQHRSGNLSTVEAAHAALQAGGETETAGELLLHFLRFQDAWSLLRPYAVRLGERPDDA